MQNKITASTLSSGARLLCIHSDLPLSSVSAWFRAGSRFDPAEKEGLAHFFEHLFALKTKKYSESNSFFKELTRHGITRNATTNREVSYYYHEQPTEKTLQSLDFLIDALGYSDFSEDVVEKEKEVIKNELWHRNSNPDDYLTYLNHRALWSKDSGSVLGSEESLASITHDDLLKFKDQYYTLSNLVFIVVSSLDPATVKNHLEESELFLPKGLPAGFLKKDSQIVPYILEKRDIPQVHVSINFKTIPERQFEEVIALDFLVNYYLANSWVSQLVQNMRRGKKIAYWVNGAIVAYRDRGYACFKYAVNPEKLRESLKVVFDEISRVKSGDIQEEDIANCKSLIWSDYLRTTINPGRIMNWYGWQSLIGDEVHTLDDDMRLGLDVSSGHLQEVANKYFTKENLAITAVGPAKEEDFSNLPFA